MTAAAAPVRRGIGSVADLRARSVIDPNTRCWIYQGSLVKGKPRIWTLNLDTLEKGVLSGPRAVWYIAHGTRLGERVAYMSCMNGACVCPVHVRAGARGDVNTIMARGGVYRRSEAAKVANRRNAARARAARGVVDTPEHLVMAVRAAAGTTTQAALARQLGLARSVVSRIVRGVNHRHIGAGQEGAA